MIKQKNCQHFVIVLMVILEIIIGCYMNQSRGITNDEIFSLGLANSTADYIFFGNDQIESNANDAGWFSGECFQNYLTVQPGERWAIKNVFANQGNDNHPPLFYLWVNMVSSFTPGELNYLGAAFINILAVCGVIVLLYCSMRKLYGDTWYNIVPGFLWLFSTACRQLTNYIRMYTLLCFFIMCMVYLHICLLKEEKISKKRVIQIAVTVCLGGLTHYYFYIFSFFLAFWYAVSYLVKWRKDIKNQYKGLIPFAGAYAMGGISALIIFPKVISHVTGSDMSQKMQDTAKSHDFPFHETLNEINDNIFYGHFDWFIFFIVVLAGISLILYYFQKKNKQKYHDETKTEISIIQFREVCILLLLPSFCFLLFVTKSALYIVWYYVSPVFAPLLLLTVVVCLPGFMIKRKLLSSLYCAVLCVAGLTLFLTVQIPDMIKTREQDATYQAMIEGIAGMDCIYVSESWNVLYGNHLPDMRLMDEIRCITPEEYSQTDLNALLAGRESADQKLVIIFRKVDDTESYVKQMELAIGKQGKILFESEKDAFYTF